jgi:phosphinothricin acetyltransferase
MVLACEIRPATRFDLPAILSIYNEAILTTTATFDTEPKDLADRERWLAGHSDRHPVLVAIVEGQVVGWSCLSPWSDRCADAGTAETTTYVAGNFRGRGIGRQLKAAILNEATRLGFHSLIARITEESHASLHLNLAFGFRHVGTLKEVGRKFGRLLDVHILQKMLDGPDAECCDGTST